MSNKISYSEFKIWSDCPYKHKLLYIDRVKRFEGNEYTAFGTAIHSTCERRVLNEIVDEPSYFENIFEQELEKLPSEVLETIGQEKVDELLEQGRVLAPIAVPELQKHFGDFEVVSVEESIFEDMDLAENTKFKGFIDLVIKTSDDKYHIIDWKTCGWGWDSRRRTDTITTYQLSLYKHYFAKKHGIDPKNIETHFALLKRTAKKNNVEIFRVTSGAKKTENALKLVAKAVHNISSGKHIKNRISCTSGYGCEFYKTKYCA